MVVDVQDGRSSALAKEIPSEQSRSTSEIASFSQAQAHTTTWLRSQLEKTAKECSTLKEDLHTKIGESKILRDKLNKLEYDASTKLQEKNAELSNMKAEYDKKIQQLEKELQRTKTQMLFKIKETESNIEKHQQLAKYTPPSSIELQQSEPCSSTRSNSYERGSAVTFPGTFSNSVAKVGITTFSENSNLTFDVRSKLKDIISLRKEKKDAHLGEELKFLTKKFLFMDAKSENSFIVPPPMDYYPFSILYRDVSEIPTSDDTSIQEVLRKIWKIEPTNEFDSSSKVRPKRSSHFIPLTNIHDSIKELFTLKQWNSSSIPDLIIEHVTKMALDLYYAFCDPAVVADNAVESREAKVIEQCLNTKELKLEFNLFSPDKNNEEIYVDLRRGIALISAMCDLDEEIARVLLQKSEFIETDSLILKSSRPSNFPCESVSWLNNEIFLTTSMKMLLEMVGPETTWTDIHIRDKFRNGTLEVGELGRLMHTFIPEDIVIWGKQRKTDTAETIFEYSKIKFFDEIEPHLEALKSSIKSSTDDETLMEVTEETTVVSSSDDEMLSPDTAERMKDETSNNRLSEQLKMLASKVETSWRCMSDESATPVSDDTTLITKTDNKKSLLDSLLKNEESQWEKVLSAKMLLDDSTSKDLDAISSSNSISRKELDLLGTAFHNFLKIKSSIVGQELQCCCQHRKNHHKEHVATEDVEMVKAKKVKRSLESYDFRSTPSTSRASLRKHDVAPLKRFNESSNITTTVEDDYKEIEEEVGRLFSQRKTPSRNVGKSPNKAAEPSRKSPRYDKKELPKESKVETLSKSMASLNITPNCDDTCKYGMLELMIEIAKYVGLKNYTIHFNPLFAAVTQLLHSCVRSNMIGAHIRHEKVCTLILEILYDRPSPIVLRNINRLIVQCISIVGFAKLMCQNAHSNKCMILNDQVTFKRGACLLTTICSLVDFISNDDDWEIQFLMFRWLAYLFFVEKMTIDSLYECQKTTSGRCSCVQVLNNTVIKLVKKAGILYLTSCIENKLTSLLKFHLTEVMEHGIRIISQIVEIDHCFSYNSHSQYYNLILFLQTVMFMHSDKDGSNFCLQLQSSDLDTVKNLLDDESVSLMAKQFSLANDELLSNELVELLSSVQTNWPSDVISLNLPSENN